MPHEPKRRHSIGRKGKRRAGIKLSLTKSITCSNCGGQTRAHAICPNCGFYKGREIIKIKKKS